MCHLRYIRWLMCGWDLILVKAFMRDESLDHTMILTMSIG